MGGGVGTLELWELIPLPFFLGIILLLEPAQPQFVLSLIFQKKLMFQPLGNIQLSFSRMGDPGADLPKGGIIPTFPMPWLLGDKIVFSGEISQVNKPGK